MLYATYSTSALTSVCVEGHQTGYGHVHTISFRTEGLCPELTISSVDMRTLIELRDRLDAYLAARLGADDRMDRTPHTDRSAPQCPAA